MKIWLITIGEPVPLQNSTNDRLLRTGYMAHYMAGKGLRVTWWTSTFNHFKKKQLFNKDHIVMLQPNLKIRLLHGCGYRHNLSIARIMDHKKIASKFTRHSKSLSPPDIIVSSLPTIELSLAAVNYGKANNVPVVIDMRDMWPDIFSEYIPKSIRPLGRLFMEPLFKKAQKACASATAITGITDEFVYWGIRRGKRVKTKKDVAFPIGYTAKIPSHDKIADAEKFWKTRGVAVNSKKFVACFIGTIGRQFDLDTVIRTAKKLLICDRQFQFVICGAGDLLDKYKAMAATAPNIIFPGWIDAAQIYVLMRRSCVGLNPIPDRKDFLITINNKAIEYMSAGLAIISSPRKGILYELLMKNGCGLSYDHGDEQQLTNILIRLYDKRENLYRMSTNAVRLFTEKFTAEKVYESMVNYLVGMVAQTKEQIGS